MCQRRTVPFGFVGARDGLVIPVGGGDPRGPAAARCSAEYRQNGPRA